MPISMMQGAALAVAMALWSAAAACQTVQVGAATTVGDCGPIIVSSTDVTIDCSFADVSGIVAELRKIRSLLSPDETRAFVEDLAAANESKSTSEFAALLRTQAALLRGQKRAEYKLDIPNVRVSARVWVPGTSKVLAEYSARVDGLPAQNSAQLDSGRWQWRYHPLHWLDPADPAFPAVGDGDALAFVEGVSLAVNCYGSTERPLVDATMLLSEDDIRMKLPPPLFSQDVSLNPMACARGLALTAPDRQLLFAAKAVDPDPSTVFRQPQFTSAIDLMGGVCLIRVVDGSGLLHVQTDDAIEGSWIYSFDLHLTQSLLYGASLGGNFDQLSHAAGMNLFRLDLPSDVSGLLQLPGAIENDGLGVCK